MAGEEILNYNNFAEGAIGGAVAGLVGTFILLFILVLIGIYVYTALANQSIFRKSGHKRPWMAWIPIVQMIPALELGGFHWAWIFLILGSAIPFVGTLATIALTVLVIISMWRIFERAGYSGAWAILLIVPIANLIVLGVIAWQKKSYKKVSKR